MFTDGTIIIGTGNDDLREGSQIWVRIYIRGRSPVVFEAARGARFLDRTDTAPINWPPSSMPLEPSRIEDVERIEVSFVPDRRGLMEDDKWWFTKLILTLNDTVSGPFTIYRKESINRKFERAGTWNSGILSTYSAIGSTLIRVFDDFRQPVPNAEVFITGNVAGRTDSTGQLLVPSSSLGAFTDIVVRHRIHEQEYFRSNHDFDSTQNWNYRVYHTNVSIDNSGIARPAWGPFSSIIDIVTSRMNTLIGLNLLVCAEWDLSLADLATLENTFKDFSAFLYNATDGQFFIEITQITDRRHLWDDSDCRVNADWNFGANVHNVIGGFLGWNILGSAMNMSRRDNGMIYAHEFGHHGFALMDEYGHIGIACTANLGMSSSAFGRFNSRASCIMFDSQATTKICSNHSSNPHVRVTDQGDEACWDTITRRYNIDPRWNLQTPESRGAIPGIIGYFEGFGLRTGFMMPTIHRRLQPDLHGLIDRLSLVIREHTGSPIPGVVIKTRDQTGSWIIQGSTDEYGTLTLVGVHVGDRLRLEAGSGSTFERDIPSGVGNILTVEIPL